MKNILGQRHEVKMEKMIFSDQTRAVLAAILSLAYMLGRAGILELAVDE